MGQKNIVLKQMTPQDQQQPDAEDFASLNEPSQHLNRRHQQLSSISQQHVKNSNLKRIALKNQTQVHFQVRKMNRCQMPSNHSRFKRLESNGNSFVLSCSKISPLNSM